VLLIEPYSVKAALKAEDFHQLRIAELAKAEDAYERVLREQFLQTSGHGESSKVREHDYRR
jgi:hypothetical protein